MPGQNRAAAVNNKWHHKAEGSNTIFDLGDLRLGMGSRIPTRRLEMSEWNHLNLAAET
jgi:hypothetical protein